MNINSNQEKDIIDYYKQLPQIVRYFLISCFSTSIDTMIVWTLYRGCGVAIVMANTVGVICGFLISYKLTYHFVFHAARGVRGFSFFFGTFLGGLVLADALIYWGETRFFINSPPNISFFLSKGLS